MPGVPASLVDRAKNIILSPKTEWPRIAAEPATVASIYTSYVMILAAIGPIAILIGQQVFGYSAFGVTYKPPIGYSVGMAVFTYLLSLVSVYVLSLVIDALATTFGGTKNPINALKVAAYSMTASWLAAIFNIIPMLGFLAALLGLYSLYLLYLGIGPLMKAPADKQVGYAVVAIVVNIVLYFVAAIVVTSLVGAFFGAAIATGGALTVG
jgi:hypothetical protein